MTPYRRVDSPALATRGHGAKRGRKVGWVRLRGQGDRENGTGQGMQHEASVRPVYHVHAYAHHPHPLHPQRTIHCPSCTQPPKCHFADDAFLRVLLACLHVHNFRDCGCWCCCCLSWRQRVCAVKPGGLWTEERGLGWPGSSSSTLTSSSMQVLGPHAPCATCFRNSTTDRNKGQNQEGVPAHNIVPQRSQRRVHVYPLTVPGNTCVPVYSTR